MDFETFRENLARDVKEALEGRNGTNYEVQHHTMEKPNGSYETVTVKPDGNMIGVNLNASALYKEYENGTPYETIVKGSTDIADKALKDGPDFNVDNFKNYDKMKGTLAMEVVSKERNAGLLENIPHKDIEDMSVVYRFDLGKTPAGTGTILVTNQMLENYGITADQLHDDAMKTAPEVRPLVIEGMCEVLAKGNHAFIVVTHTDRNHIHNHVIFNSTTLKGDRKFTNFSFSGIALGRLSNLICMENGLSVIAPMPYHSKTTYIHAERGPTFRDGIRDAIDTALSKRPGSFDELLSYLAEQGYEIKRGKHTSVRGNGQTRFIRFRSLGDGYTEKDLLQKLEGVARGKEETKAALPKENAKPFYREKDFDLLLNMQEIIAQGKGPGYELWAKKYNVKNVMKALLFFQEQGLRTYDELEKRAGDTSERFSELSDQIKGYEKRLKEISELKSKIIDYSRTKDIYQQYKQSGYSRQFFAEHKDDIMTHKAAKDSFNKHKAKLPSVKELSDEYGKVLEKKKAAYSEYKEVRKNMQTYQTAKYDIDKILGIEKTPDQNKTREQTR